MSTRLAGVCDLVAAEACYHLPCMIRFERQCKQKQPSFAEEGQRYFCLNQLCVYLIRGLERGHVYDMVDVWSTYEKMCSDMDVEPPQRYQSRRTTLYEDIQRLIGPQACFVRPFNKSSVLMYPRDKSDCIIAKTLGKSKQGFTVLESASSEEKNEVNITLTGANAYQEKVHVALGI